MKEKDNERIMRGWAIRAAIEKQVKFFEEHDPNHIMDEETNLDSFLGDNSGPLETDQNGFIDFENAYDD